MPDFGIGETLAALGIGDLFGFGGGAAAGLADVGIGTIGADAAGAAAAGSSLADIVGTGTGLAAGETGLAGTLGASGTGLGIADLAAGTGGLGALGTAADFLAAPGASALGSGAALPAGIGSGALGTGAGASGANAALGAFQPQAFGGATALSPNVANANAGASVFETGTNAVPGVGTTGAPAALAPSGTGASALAAPAGVTAPLGVDPTAAATGVATSAAPAATSSSIDSLLGKAGSGVMNSLTSNPLGIGLGAAGLGYNIYAGQKQSANQKSLAGAAQTAADTGQKALNAGLPIATANNATGTSLINSGEALQTYLSTGQLPAQYTQQIDQAINDAKTRAISNAAQQGMPTDPTQNTSLAATLAGIDNQRAGMTSQIAQTLFNAGSSDINAGAGLTTQSASSLLGAGQNASGLSAQLYQSLVANDTAQAANTGKAIATLAAALNGKSSNTAGNVTISTG